jgi:hypothetical protein
MNRTYRMYGLVPYNLSPIQQGIQFGHAVQEYNNMMIVNNSLDDRRAFDLWRMNDKTFIILNGGTTNNSLERPGTLNKFLFELGDTYIPVASFYEPDLGDQLTAFVFLVDDRVFDRVTWPDYSGKCYVDGTPEAGAYWEWKMKFADTESEADRIVWLRTWLRNFKLA